MKLFASRKSPAVRARAFLCTLPLFILLVALYSPSPVPASPIIVPSSTPQILNNIVSTVLEPPQAGIPARLKIPKIKVDAPVLPVGITAEGAMDIPQNPSDTAWLKQGPNPGNKGSSVINGHYVWKKNRPAVFDDLDTLHIGDLLQVEDVEGVVTTFVVREIRTYRQDADTSDVFGSSDGKAHLNLITCEGAWDEEQNTYSHRLVVFSDKV